jgi:hypothetical protein
MAGNADTFTAILGSKPFSRSKKNVSARRRTQVQSRAPTNIAKLEYLKMENMKRQW